MKAKAAVGDGNATIITSVCVLCYERCLFLRELFLLFFYFIHDLNFASENLFFYISYHYYIC